MSDKREITEEMAQWARDNGEFIQGGLIRVKGPLHGDFQEGHSDVNYAENNGGSWGAYYGDVVGNDYLIRNVPTAHGLTQDIVDGMDVKWENAPAFHSLSFNWNASPQGREHWEEMCNYEDNAPRTPGVTAFLEELLLFKPEDSEPPKTVEHDPELVERLKDRIKELEADHKEQLLSATSLHDLKSTPWRAVRDLIFRETQCSEARANIAATRLEKANAITPF